MGFIFFFSQATNIVSAKLSLFQLKNRNIFELLKAFFYIIIVGEQNEIDK